MRRNLYGCAVVVMCVIAGVAGYELIDWGSMHSSDWASWVQAVGSIAAILGAIWVSRDERRHAKILRDEDRERARVRLAADVLAIASDSVDFLERAIGAVRNKQPGVVGHNETELTDILERIAAARATDIGKKRWAQLATLRVQLLRGVEILRVSGMRTITTGGGLYECYDTVKHVYKDLLVEQGKKSWNE